VDAFDLERVIGSNAVVLDIGCGSGELSGILEKRTGLVVGIDRSAVALDLATKRSAGKRVHYVSGAAEALPLSNGSFDNVVAFGVMEHIQDYQRFISEIHRVMKRGAIAFISSSNARSFLQTRNYVLAMMGRYPYGFQKNWTVSGLDSMLRERFQIEKRFIMQADSDMPIITNLDRIAARFIPSWGRYICFVVSKSPSGDFRVRPETLGRIAEFSEHEAD
jgi:ubiquinone/menaquinone biosynthesis C-methylase UbiE